ncbi:MAG: hypothetical protein HC915_15420 [Anaerolineae bacterium]|nr:hypothetical protein [Anaerolineae bacterium]
MMLCGVVLGLGLRGASLAQQPFLPLSYDQAVSGEVTTEAFQQLYAFEGAQGEVITLSLTTLEGDLDPVLLLLDQDGGLLGWSDDEGDGYNAVLDSVQLPVTGRYFAVATRFGQAMGSTTGRYSLLITRLGRTVERETLLNYGDRVIGQVSGEVPQTVYFFEGRRGDAVSISLQRTSGNLDPFLQLANAERQILVQQDDDPAALGRLDAHIVNYQLPITGLYIIVASRYGQEAGTTSGNFVLSLQRMPDEARGFSLATAILLDYENQASGQISGDAPQRYYAFEGQRGEVISVGGGARKRQPGYVGDFAGCRTARTGTWRHPARAHHRQHSSL